MKFIIAILSTIGMAISFSKATAGTGKAYCGIKGSQPFVTDSGVAIVPNFTCWTNSSSKRSGKLFTGEKWGHEIPDHKSAVEMNIKENTNDYEVCRDWVREDQTLVLEVAKFNPSGHLTMTVCKVVSKNKYDWGW